jgi:hypothetical protein
MQKHSVARWLLRRRPGKWLRRGAHSASLLQAKAAAGGVRKATGGKGARVGLGVRAGLGTTEEGWGPTLPRVGWHQPPNSLVLRLAKAATGDNPVALRHGFHSPKRRPMGLG